jgi:hypothetical protein
MDKAVSRVRSRAAIAALALAVCVLVAGPASGANHKTRTAKFSVAIALLGPTNGTTVARYGASPTFSWKISLTGKPPARGSGRLEVSTSPSFNQSAVFRFDCGYTSGDCPSSYQWPNQTPFWYDQANSCSDVPPSGTNCGSLSTTLYWRVRYEPVGAKSYTSPVGVLQRSAPTDTRPPTVNALNGTSAYGSNATVYFHAGDNSGLVRDVVELYDSSGNVVFGVRTEWNTVPTSGQSYQYITLPLPPSIQAGTYKSCVTVVDQNDNRATDCAIYTIT